MAWLRASTAIYTHTRSQLHNYMSLPHATARQMRHLRFKVCVLSHFLLQPLQETQVCSRTRTNTFFILQNRNRSFQSQHHTPSIPSLNAPSSCGKCSGLNHIILCTSLGQHFQGEEGVVILSNLIREPWNQRDWKLHEKSALPPI